MNLIPVLLMLMPASEGPALTGFPELTVPALAQDAPAEDEAPKWTGSLALGANWSGGNTKTSGVNGTADAEYRRAKDRTSFGGYYAYSKDRVADIVSEDRYGAKAQYDYFISEKTYALAQTSYDVDTVASLRSRVTAGAGMGRQFREDDVLKFSGEAGLAWRDEVYPNDQGSDDLTSRLAYNLDWTASKLWQFTQSTTILPVVDDLEDFYLVVDSRAKATISGNLFAQLQYVLEHDETPAAGKDMTDHRVLLSVGWNF